MSEPMTDIELIDLCNRVKNPDYECTGEHKDHRADTLVIAGECRRLVRALSDAHKKHMEEYHEIARQKNLREEEIAEACRLLRLTRTASHGADQYPEVAVERFLSQIGASRG